MAIFKSKTSRRKEVRKAMPKPRPPLWPRLTRGRNLLATGLLAFYILIAGLLLVDARRDPPQRVDQTATRTYLSRVAFRSLDSVKTEEIREQEASLVPPVYQLNENFLRETQKGLQNLPLVVATVEYENLAPEVQKTFALTPEAYEALKEYQTDGVLSERWTQQIDRIIDTLRTQILLLDSERYQNEKVNVATSVRIENPDKRVRDEDVFNVADEKGVRRALSDHLFRFPGPISTTIVSYFTRNKIPTHTYDAARTAQAQKSAKEGVPNAFTQYERDSVLISAGNRITADGYKLLQLEQAKYLSSLPDWARWMYFAGPILLMTVLSILIAVVIGVIKPRIIQNPARGLAMFSLLLITLALSRITSPYWWAAAAIAPAVLLAVILAIAYDTRLAAAIAVLHAAAICLIVQQGLGLYIVTILTCIVAIVQLVEVRKRGRLIRMGLVSGVTATAGVLIVALSAWQFLPEKAIDTFSMISVQATAAGVGTISVGFFVLGALPFIERVFKVTTSMTLLELADMDHPLLKRLAQEAPGTFNHSLQVATLAEAGVEAIGGNSLLSRVGSYYHDIGKTHKPGYFVENQSGATSRHEKLSPAMSLLIIVAHVKDGVEMAREFGLPTSIIQFIETHHGTTLVEYFYHAAKKKRDERQQPEEIEFRYPGPKPQTKEAAVVMICDASESACRAMAEPTPTRIEQLVRKITQKRLLDGQFDQCDITLNELRLVEEAVTKALTSIYHGRIHYPQDETKQGQSGQNDSSKQPQRVAG